MSAQAQHLKALSSKDGKEWWGSTLPFPWPAAPDASVRRVVLGTLDNSIELSEAVLAGLKCIEDHFPALTHLHLWGLSNLQKVDGLPASLRCLDVRKCAALTGIGELPAALETLDLGECSQLPKLLEGTDELNNLRECWLNGCAKLKKIDPLKNALKSVVPGTNTPCLVSLVLHGCRFADLGAELCGTPGENVVAKVRGHYEEINEQGTTTMAECKVVVLGDGGVGKTQLVRALKGLPFQEGDAASPSTEGIHLWSWTPTDYQPFPTQGVNQVALNIWDFGGQDLYHNTHRLFLESKAVFVVVWCAPDPTGKPHRDSFPNEVTRPLNYWLDQIRSANPHASILVVRTQADKNIQATPWQQQVREAYRTLPDFEVSAKTPNPAAWLKLRQALFAAVTQELQGLGSVTLAKGRALVRAKLKDWQPAADLEGNTNSSTRPLLRVHEFHDDVVAPIYVPKGWKTNAERSGLLLSYLHDSGAIYYPEKWRSQAWLQRMGLPGGVPIIVDQSWVIAGVYELIRPTGAARAALEQMGGQVAFDVLLQSWDEVAIHNYSQLDRWVMCRFMESCGLLVEQGNVCILPDLLPAWETLAQEPTPQAWVVQAQAGGRTWSTRHGALGRGFGCLLVGALVREFKHKPLLFRHGALGLVKVGSQFDGDEAEVLIKVEWGIAKDDYFGNFQLTIYGESKADEDIVELVQRLIHTLPGMPSDVQFFSASGKALSAERGPVLHAGSNAVAVQFQSSWLQVALSVAGGGEAEALASAVQRGVKALGTGYKVLYYKTEHDHASVLKLISSLSQSDLMLCFISNKYLESPYCMQEFFGAAQHYQPHNTFNDPNAWVKKVWPLLLPEVQQLMKRTGLGIEQAAEERRKLATKWQQNGSDYRRETNIAHGDPATAEREAPKNYSYHAWMRFAENSVSDVQAVLAAIANANSRRDFQAPAVDMAQVELERWADSEVARLGLAQKILNVLQQQLADWKPIDARQRLQELCLAAWERGDATGKREALELYKELLQQQPNPGLALDKAFSGTPPVAALAAVNAHWLHMKRNA
jgi:hypothetical protein